MAEIVHRTVTIPKPSATASNKSKPTTRLVAASEIAQWPVHPLCDFFPFWPPDRIDRLAESPRRLRKHTVTLYRGYVIDGRNHIVAGVIANVDLPVEDHEDLAEQQVEELFFTLNPHRRDLPKSQLIELAASYYDVVQHTEHALTLHRVADLFHISKRSLCRYRKHNDLLANTSQVKQR